MLYGVALGKGDLVEENLAALGYDTGPVDGVETMKTVIAISKFQAENGMEVSGEVTPQLAGILAAKADNPDLETGGAKATAAAPPARDPAALQAAQQSFNMVQGLSLFDYL